MLIRTKRLHLRCLDARDGDAVLRMLNDWEVAQWLSAPPYTYSAGDFEAYLDVVRRDHAGGNPTRFAVAEAETDGLVGGIGIELTENRAGELGYWLGRDHWGQGYAGEAAQAIVPYALGRLPVDRLVAVTDPDNVRSQQVLLKAGFRPSGTRSRETPTRRGATNLRVYAVEEGSRPALSEA